jgi:hypothetical protein
MKFGNLFEAIRKAKTKEYDAILDQTYTPEFAKIIKDCDKASEQQFGKADIETTGNIYIKFIDTPRVAFILGMISKEGRMTREELEDMKIWIKRLEDALNEGKKVMTSLNKFSTPFINRIMKRDPEVKMKKLGGFENEEGTWVTVELYK